MRGSQFYCIQSHVKLVFIISWSKKLPLFLSCLFSKLVIYVTGLLPPPLLILDCWNSEVDGAALLQDHHVIYQCHCARAEEHGSFSWKYKGEKVQEVVVSSSMLLCPSQTSIHEAFNWGVNYGILSSLGHRIILLHFYIQKGL